MKYTEICNAVWMFLWVGVLLLAVILQCLIFMKRAWKHAVELGLSPAQIKKGLTPEFLLVSCQRYLFYWYCYP